MLSRVSAYEVEQLHGQELKEDGVDTRGVLRAEGQASPFTYIIVDRTGDAPPPPR